MHERQPHIYMKMFVTSMITCGFSYVHFPLTSDLNLTHFSLMTTAHSIPKASTLSFQSNLWRIPDNTVHAATMPFILHFMYSTGFSCGNGGISRQYGYCWLSVKVIICGWEVLLIRQIMQLASLFWHLWTMAARFGSSRKCRNAMCS